MKTQPFYNTVQLSREELKEAVAKCLSQEEAVFQIYYHTRKPYTVSDILRACEKAGHRCIKVSIGRAITNLKKKSDLVMLTETKESIHKAKEHYYQLNFDKYPSQTGEQTTLFKEDKAA